MSRLTEWLWDFFTTKVVSRDPYVNLVVCLVLLLPLLPSMARFIKARRDLQALEKETVNREERGFKHWNFRVEKSEEIDPVKDWWSAAPPGHNKRDCEGYKGNSGGWRGVGSQRSILPNRRGSDIVALHQDHGDALETLLLHYQQNQAMLHSLGRVLLIMRPRNRLWARHLFVDLPDLEREGDLLRDDRRAPHERPRDLTTRACHYGALGLLPPAFGEWFSRRRFGTAWTPHPATGTTIFSDDFLKRNYPLSHAALDVLPGAREKQVKEHVVFFIMSLVCNNQFDCVSTLCRDFKLDLRANVFKELLPAVANVGVIDSQTTSRMMRLLLQHGASHREFPPIFSRAATTLLHCAAHSGNMVSLRILLEKEDTYLKASPPEELPVFSSLTDTTAPRDLDAPQVVGPLVSHVDCDGMVPLHTACMAGQLEAVKVLLDPQYTLRPTSYSREPHLRFVGALNAAARGDCLEIVQFILAEIPAAEINLTLMSSSQWGQTAIHTASYYGSVEIVQAMFEASRLAGEGQHCGSFSLSSFPVLLSGTTPLHLAAAQGKNDIIELLLQAGGSVHAQNERGNTPLQDAELQSEKTTVRLLRKHGAKRATPQWKAEHNLEGSTRRIRK